MEASNETSHQGIRRSQRSNAGIAPDRLTFYAAEDVHDYCNHIGIPLPSDKYGRIPSQQGDQRTHFKPYNNDTNSGSRAKVAATLREYLACEYKAKMAHLGRERIFNKETFRGCCPKVPQQPNFSDCGLYLLQYIEAFFEVSNCFNT